MMIDYTMGYKPGPPDKPHFQPPNGVKCTPRTVDKGQEAAGRDREHMRRGANGAAVPQEA